MRRFLVLLLSAVMIFSLAACGNNKKETESADTETAAEENVDEAAAAASADVIERPENYGTVKIGDYKGLEVTVEETEVTDEDVQAELDNALANFQIDITGRPVQEGDTVNIDYEGKKDGVVFDGGTAQDQYLTIGSGRFIEGFEDGLIGAEIGETRELNLRFPDDYPSEELAGADAVFTVTVNGIQAPADDFSDEWVESYTAGQYKTMDEFRVVLREDLEEYAKQTAEDNAKSELLQQILDNSQFTPEKDAVDYEYQQILNSYSSYIIQYYGVSLEDYMATAGIDQETLESELGAYAETAVNQQLAVNDIFDKEGMKIEEADEQVLADMYGVTIDEVREAFGEDVFEQNVKTTKVLQFVFDNAIQK